MGYVLFAWRARMAPLCPTGGGVFDALFSFRRTGTKVASLDVPPPAAEGRK